MQALVAQLDAHQTGNQVVGLIPSGSSNILLWREKKACHFM